MLFPLFIYLHVALLGICRQCREKLSPNATILQGEQRKEASDGEPPATEFTDEGKMNDETIATLVEDLEKLAINPECSLYQPTSSQEDTSDDTSSQATCGSGSHPPDKPADDGKKQHWSDSWT
ncbi:Hypothetical predicted protein [Paramuricea clavata]|uniref:Uncharacterized protein n=1 Tax=Paramuricea clavata TaxID=317549 RepID=A0A7D9DWC5_PARCT|nr:Hypothetical predicted protein [Paramuricea clavata]